MILSSKYGPMHSTVISKRGAITVPVAYFYGLVTAMSPSLVFLFLLYEYRSCRVPLLFESTHFVLFLYSVHILASISSRQTSQPFRRNPDNLLVMRAPKMELSGLDEVRVGQRETQDSLTCATLRVLMCSMQINIYCFHSSTTANSTGLPAVNY